MTFLAIQISPGGLEVAVRALAGLAGAFFIFYFFKSLIRVGVLNQRFQDPLAFWTGRLVLRGFQWRMWRIPRGDLRRSEILTWYWPCALISVITVWFLLVMVGFGLLNWGFRADKDLTQAMISSGSALSTLGFSTPGSLTGQVMAIIEGAIGLFLIVYLFTFLPGFLDLVSERGDRVAWIYARTGPMPSGVGLLLWYYESGRGDEMDTVFEEWEGFFRKLSQARSFLAILCVIRPLNPSESWVCAFGAFLDAMALKSTTVAKRSPAVEICLDCAVQVIKNFHSAMRGTPINPLRSPAQMHVERRDYEEACRRLEAAGVPLLADREGAWQNFIRAHMRYEEEVAWLAEALSDPTPVFTTRQPPIDRGAA